MNILFHIVCYCILYTFTSSYSAESLYYYRQAQPADTDKILYIINTQAYQDRTKIVILPEIFRKSTVEKKIRNGRLFVATDRNNNIAGYKELYPITDESEFNELGSQELRFFNSPININLYDPQGNKKESISENRLPQFSLKNSAIIYFGGDYTMVSYRNRGINSNLTKNAFECISDNCIQMIKKNYLKHLVLVYGLTKSNAGENNGIDRTPSIIRAFMHAAHKIAHECEYKKTETVIHSRYHSFMPTFDPHDTECKPLDDSHAIAGYGNVLIFTLVP